MELKQEKSQHGGIVTYYYIKDGIKIPHRDDGPAFIDIRTEVWYYHGLKHRKDGPAIKMDDHIFWYYADVSYEFHDWLKVNTEITEEQKLALILRYEK